MNDKDNIAHFTDDGGDFFEKPRIKRGRSTQTKESVCSDILNFTIDSSIEKDLQSLFKIPSFKDLTPSIIGEIICQSPLLEARWGVLYNESVSAFEKKEVEFEIWQAKKDFEIRSEASENNEKLTEPKIKNLIICDQNFKKMQHEIIEAKKKMNNLKSISIALISKGNKAISAANLVKEEMKLTSQI